MVVYATNVDSSDDVKNYYINTRNIPSINVIGLSIPDSIVYQEGTVKLFDGREDIRGDGNLGWRYVKDVIADTVEYYLNNTYVYSEPLSERIRYIVLCKGIPHKIRSLPYVWNTGYRRQASVGALLCLINQPDTTKNFLQLYNTSRYSHVNPLFQVDPDITMDYRFKSNHFVNSGGWYTQYLVSWLNGDTYADVLNLIDRLADPDYTGEKTWVLDADPDASYHQSTIYNTYDELDGLGFYTNYDNTHTYITTDDNNVIGYVSDGVHAGMPANYILELLEFDYTNGASFISWESFNAYSFGYFTSTQVGQGLISDFIHMGGSVASGHCYEPFVSGATYDDRTYPAYAMGYTDVDAHYQGIYFNAWQNVVLGDPLTAIAWGKQTLTQNLTWSGRNLVTGEITIPVPYTTLTIDDDSYIELRHEGFIPCEVGYGRLIVGEDVTFETDSWDRALFLSYDSENARLIWADHPTFPSILYNIYRKIDDGDWEYIASTADNEYTDEEVSFTCYECYVNATVYYFVKGVNAQERESEASNEVSAEVIAKIGKESGGDKQQGKVYEYSLSHNYPNPFNPTTRIFYSIKEAGLVSLSVYDILGNEVSVLVKEDKSPGSYSVTFNAGNLPSGIYFYKLTAGRFSETKKLILLK